MAKQNGKRRTFSAEFKLEAVRRTQERRPQGVSLAQIGRELGVRPDMLRAWAKRAEERAGAPPRDIFPGQGHLPTEQEELRRLQRENARLQQEVEFLKKAAAYFAKESR
jgi:transposase